MRIKICWGYRKLAEIWYDFSLKQEVLCRSRTNIIYRNFEYRVYNSLYNRILLGISCTILKTPYVLANATPHTDSYPDYFYAKLAKISI